MYFDNQHRLGNDQCWVDGQVKQSQQINDYYLFNPYKTNVIDCDENESKLREFMVENKKNYREGYGVTNACHVDNDSKMRSESKKLTHGKCKNQLSSRLFQAAPDLSHGGFESLLESRLTQGHSTGEKKSCEVTQGKGFDVMTPMLPCLKKQIQNVDHIVPTWVRGGEHTRDHINQKDFLENNGYVFDEKVWKKKTC
jgi:hypothetical protein